MNLIQKIEAYCDDNNLTILDFFKKAKINKSNYYRWKNNNFEPNQKSIRMVTEAMK